MSDEREDETPAAPDLPNAADPAKVRRRQTESQFRDQQVADFWRRCLADRIGRMVLWGLLMDCHTFEERFSTTPAGAAYTVAAWYAAGEREVGQRMWRTWLRVDPAAVAMMHSEFDFLAVRKTPAKRR